MHEMSLVRSIFRTLEDEFPADKMNRLAQVNLQVGLLANVEPILMQSAFQALTETDKQYEAVKLEIETVPVAIYCSACDHKSEVHQYKFVCEECGQLNNNVVQGTELLIHQVHFNEKLIVENG
ncbi:hydrogenase maturation nickel metallochaperone HypA [Tunicatimonas pelagia]|uniref:hydrogenase maturation nickel metallochaperone HypA/HybF n=1 Tax=Tunicatimonas pelagia TaxID=931531 RepID=UPI0026661980|nr:hydrogenase maturation nickel metallochaperone HypA [Tunicatimonas pelagia]WKN41326.1 hydrogenase maturation nickel metallochaperone HypA [Tunicatimonas pelagia]